MNGYKMNEYHPYCVEVKTGGILPEGESQRQALPS